MARRTRGWRTAYGNDDPNHVIQERLRGRSAGSSGAVTYLVTKDQPSGPDDKAPVKSGSFTATYSPRKYFVRGESHEDLTSAPEPFLSPVRARRRAHGDLTSPNLHPMDAVQHLTGADPEYTRHVFGTDKSMDTHLASNAANRFPMEPGHIATIRNHPAFEPKLFDEIPPSLTIDNAVSHTAVSRLMPSLMARAHLDFGKPDIKVPTSLSSHSSKLAQHAKDLGMPLVSSGHNPTMQQTNDIDFDDSFQEYASDYEGLFSEIPTEEMGEAHGHLRSMIRGSRPRKEHMGPQFEHPTLFNLEDY